MLLAVGNTYTHKRQNYLCVGLEPYVRRDGAGIELALLKTQCARCGLSFTFKLRAEAEKFQPNRNCSLHSRPLRTKRAAKIV